ncbi:succinate dehydrogenase, hydrophobic membrane anchor protein [Aestuariibacter sp. AA17]|uniref:Succinate dehydrogenase hydrophobic membrane anchor subunit n=1 Tax=Fluctibacter corallii TaxID=2984329 RepID=A0ABT3A9L5_9ALTE|nr:succinate dehydrogenase, hydrophobic membrane anchor protein [Aestuariibacter sp. AA17]MCV2885294.1 succinate dehydrogenase, hydrophobic membrane anchor protein [Aestuariibacter sp. AA17]
MVTNQATIKRDGVQDFVTLRLTALIITAFTLFMGWYFISTPEITYASWSALFSGIAMKVFTLATLISIMLHVRIGLWQVLTDYVKQPGLRSMLQWILNIMAFAYAAYGLFVLLGV